MRQSRSKTKKNVILPDLYGTCAVQQLYSFL